MMIFKYLWLIQDDDIKYFWHKLYANTKYFWIKVPGGFQMVQAVEEVCGVRPVGYQ